VGILDQLLVTLRAPGAPSRLKGRGWGYLGLYLGLASLLLGGLGWLLVSQQEGLRRALLGYLLPERLVFAGDLLIGHLLRSQTQAVLVNAVASGTLVLVSVLLFPVKEKLSAVFETESDLTGAPFDEHPLWRQGFEELKLLVLYAAVFAGIFWIGYAPSAGRKLSATVLSYGFLFFSFSVDFISPLLQRHRVSYAQALIALLGRPLLCLGFGATFALPSILAGLVLKHSPGLSFLSSVVLLFGANLLGICWAAIAGTWVGAQLLPAARETRPAPLALRGLAWLGILALLGYSLFVFVNLGAALHQKSQILKCQYRADWSSFKLDLPKLSLRSAVGSLLSGTIPVGARLTVQIHNPTPVDVTLEKNRIEILHRETLVARTRLAPLQVPAGETREERIAFTLEINPRAILKGRSLISRDWRITLLLEIAPDLEFPIYLLSP
jgi:uncharacterized protein involved in cysteine biosynthesis